MHPVPRRTVLGATGAGITSFMLPGAASAASSGDGTSPPDGTTSVAWTSGDLFDAWSSRSGVTSSDQPATTSISWQLFQAHVDIEIPSGTSAAYGVNTYDSGENSWGWWASVSTVPDTIGLFASPFQVVAVSNKVYTSGELCTAAATATLQVPAGRYFLIGVGNLGPLYRCFNTLAASRTAVIGSTPQFSALNRVYYGVNGNSGAPLPSQVGGTGTFFTQLDGYAAVISIRPSVA